MNHGTNEKNWIALDPDGEVYGRFSSNTPLSEAAVLRLVRSLLPEVNDLLVLPWNRASLSQRSEASALRPFTPLTCTKLGLRILPEPTPKPASPVEQWANRLQKRYARTAGGNQ